MAATSVTGIGQGAADNTSPPSVKFDRLTGPFGPTVLIAGVGKLVGGEVTIRHQELPDFNDTIIIATSVTSNPVWVFARNDNLFIVNGTGSDDFWWIIVTIGVHPSLLTPT